MVCPYVLVQLVSMSYLYDTVEMQYISYGTDVHIRYGQQDINNIQGE